MKRITVHLCALVLALCGTAAQAQDAAIDLLTHTAKEYAQGYANPLGNLFSAVFNSGQYHTADVSGFHVYASLQVTGAFVPPSEKTFSPTVDIPVGNTVVHRHFDNAPTILGGETTQMMIDTTINGDHISVPLPSGIGADFVPLVVPHVEVGTLWNTELILRGIPSIETNSKIGKVGFYGIGARHSLSNYIPLMPVNLSVQLMYQHLSAGDIATMDALNAAVLASIDLPAITLYAGLQMEQASIHVSYDLQSTELPPEHVDMTFSSTNNLRATVGATMKLFILYINGQVTFAEYPTAGLGVGVRIPPSLF